MSVPSIILFIVGILAVSLTMSGKFDWSEYHSFVFLGLAIMIVLTWELNFINRIIFKFRKLVFFF